MLISFSVGNFRSFKEVQTLSMEATNITEFPENTFMVGNTRLLKSVGIYGANASGKSNLLLAIATMKVLLKESASTNSKSELPVEPFLLTEGTENSPSLFEIEFFANDNRFRYGFQVDTERVHVEYLFSIDGEIETTWFTRENQEITLGDILYEAEIVRKLTRPNAFFLSILDQFSISSIQPVWRYIMDDLNFFGDNNLDIPLAITLDMISNASEKDKIMKLLRLLDLEITDIDVQTREIDIDSLSALEKEALVGTRFHNQKKVKIYTGLTKHNTYKEDGTIQGVKSLDLENQESKGTLNLLGMLGPVSKVLEGGLITFFDEIGANLHPLQTIHLISLFNSDSNSHAQLIFTTHDTNLLTYGGLRRDQIYFTEKEKMEDTRLYSLVEFRDENNKRERKDRQYEKAYLQGRYGAIPFIKNFNTIGDEE